MADEASGQFVLLAVLATTFRGPRGAVAAGLAVGAAAAVRYHSGARIAADRAFVSSFLPNAKTHLKTLSSRPSPRGSAGPRSPPTTSRSMARLENRSHSHAGSSRSRRRPPILRSTSKRSSSFGLECCWRLSSIRRGSAGLSEALCCSISPASSSTTSTTMVRPGSKSSSSARDSWKRSFRSGSSRTPASLPEFVEPRLESIMGKRRLAIGAAAFALGSILACGVIFYRHDRHLKEYVVIRDRVAELVPDGSTVVYEGPVAKLFLVPLGVPKYFWLPHTFQGRVMDLSQWLSKTDKPWYLVLAQNAQDALDSQLGQNLRRRARDVPSADRAGRALDLARRAGGQTGCRSEAQRENSMSSKFVPKKLRAALCPISSKNIGPAWTSAPTCSCRLWRMNIKTL